MLESAVSAWAASLAGIAGYNSQRRVRDAAMGKLRMSSNRRAWATLFATLPAVPLALAQGQPSVVWESRFDAAHAAPAEYPLQGPEPRSSLLASARSGDVYLYALNQLGQPSVARVRSSNQTVLWRRAAMTTARSQDVRLFDARPMSDGGTLVMAGAFSRFDVNGRLLWSRAVNTGVAYPASVVEEGNGNLVILDHVSVAGGQNARILRIVGESGVVLDAHDLPRLGLGGCYYELLAPSLDGGLYISNGCAASVSKLAADFSTVWRAFQSMATSGPQSAVSDPSGLYITARAPGSFKQSVKLATADGSVVWEGGLPWDHVRFDAAGRLIGDFAEESGTRVVAVDAQTGNALWSSDAQATRVVIETYADRVFVAGTASDGSGGFVTSFDGASGAPGWRTALQAGVPGRTILPRGMRWTPSGLLVSGADCSAPTVCRTGLVRLNETSGVQASVVFPEIAQSPVVTASDAGAGTLLVASVEGGASGQRVSAKRFDSAGPTGWSREFGLGAANGGIDTVTAMAVPDGGAVLGVNTPTLTYPYLARHAADGSPIWNHLLTLLDDGLSRAVYRLQISDQGQAFASVGRINWLGHVGTSIERFDDVTGSVLWSMPTGVNLSGNLLPFTLAANDPLVPGFPDIARYSGATGALQWDNPAFLRARRMFVPAAGQDYGCAVTVDGRIAAFSLSDGQLRWTATYPLAAGELLAIDSAVLGPDGDLYLAGMRRNGSVDTGIALRLNGQTGALVWDNRFDASSRTIDAAATVRHVDADAVWITQSTPFHTFLIRLDPTTGEMLDGSLLGASRMLDEAAFGTEVRYGQRLDDGSLLAYGSTHDPDRERRPWVARLPAPSAAPRGELALSLTVSALSLTTDWLTVDVFYAGSTALTDARIQVRLGDVAANGIPAYAAGAEDVYCIAVGGGSCTAKALPTGLTASLDLQPGAAVRLNARVKVFEGLGARAVAEVYAPYGLFETNLADNRGTRPLGDRIFIGGFDPP